MNSRVCLSIIAVVSLLSSCRGSDPAGVRPQLNVVVGIAAGDKQTGVVDHQLTDAIVAQVKDAQTLAPASGVIVNWVVVSGGGHVFAGSALTDAQGLARERWTLGPAMGEQVLEARAVDENGVPVVFTRATATGTADVAAYIGLSLTPPGNGLHVGDTVLVEYWYNDRFENRTWLCADGGSPDRLTWASLDSARAVPLGTLIEKDGRRYSQVVGTGVGLVDITAQTTGCVPAGTNALGSVQYNVQ